MASEQAQVQQQERQPGQKPLCPICHKADEVKTSRAAYETGVERLAPPPMPGKSVHMMTLVGPAVILVGIGVFFIFVLLGAGDFGVAQVIQVIITLAVIIAALVLSFIAFQRIVQGDNEATLRYPAWDRAMANWRRLYYCGRDDVIFDAQSGKVVSEQALRALLKVEAARAEAEQQSSTVPSHP